ncbi:antA/AntB antirepressor family protein [Enterobacter hormaechei]|uniref:antA/AntB antirepressor family protein n=1 Tax=Enterobacter hormaechei TaxID=158836 RepID=UPI003CC5DA6B
MGKLPELIPVIAGSIDGQPVSLVSAKRLHTFLGVGRDFTTWIKGRISQYGFTAGVDFTVVENLSTPVSGSAKYRQQIAHDYLITIDMGKELAMVERNDKGGRFASISSIANAKQKLIPEFQNHYQKHYVLLLIWLKKR